MVNNMDIDPQHRQTLLDIEKALSPYVDEIIEMKEHYDEIFDNLPDEEKDDDEANQLIIDLEELGDKLDSAIMSIRSLLT